MSIPLVSPFADGDKNFSNDTISAPSASIISSKDADSDVDVVGIVTANDFSRDSQIGNDTNETNIETVNRSIDIINWQEYVVRTESSSQPVYECSICALAGEWRTIVHHVQAIHELLVDFGSSKNKADRRSRFKYWLCDQCDFRALDFNHLSKHHACHDGAIRQYVCKHCSYSTNNRKSFKNHASCHSKAKTSVCRALVETPSRSALCAAQGIEEQNVPDEEVRIKYRTREKMEKRSQTVQAGPDSTGSFSCPKCGNSYLTRLKLEKHMWMKHNGASPASKVLSKSSYRSTAMFCPYCRYFSLRKDRLSDHIRRRHKNINVPPPIATSDVPPPTAASKSYSSRMKHSNKLSSNLAHAKKFALSKSAKNSHCPQCSFRTKWKYALQRHMSKKHKFKGTGNEVISSATNKSAGAQASLVSNSFVKGLSGDGMTNADCQLAFVRNVILDYSDEEKCWASGDRDKVVNNKMNSDNSDTHVKDPHDVSLNGWGGYTCKACSKNFSLSYQLEKHKTSCLNLKQYMCKVCGTRSNYKQNLKKHLDKIHHLPFHSKYIVLKSSSKASPSKETRRLKVSESSSKAGQICLNGKDADRMGSLKGNAPSVSADPMTLGDQTNCKICSKQFSTVYRLNRHMNIHRDLKLFKCKKCGFRSNFKSCVMKHALNQHGLSDESKFFLKLTPSEAQKTLAAYRTSRNTLACNTNSSHGSEDNVKVSSHPDMNDAGNRLSVSPEKRPNSSSNEAAVLTCHICPKTFDSAMKLSKHITMHEDLRVFMCKICGHRCNFSETLRKHGYRSHGLHNSASFLIRLTPSDARDTIETYKSSMQLVTKKADHCDSAKNEQISFKRPMTARKTRRVIDYKGELSVNINFSEGGSETKLSDMCQSSDEQMQCDSKNMTAGEHSESSEINLAGNTSDMVSDERTDDVIESISSVQSKLKKEPCQANFMCSECGFLAKWSSGAYYHKNHVHPQARVLNVSSSISQPLASNKAGNNSIAHVPQSLLKTSAAVGLNRLRRYMCQECGYRSNWRKTVKRHIKDRHPFAKIIFLSIEEAQQALNNCKKEGETSPKKTSGLDPEVVHSSPPKSRDSGILTGTYDSMRIKRFSCPLCYFRSNYRFEVTKHHRVIHKSVASQVMVLPEMSARSTLKEYNRHYCGKSGFSRKTTANNQHTVDSAVRERNASVSKSVTEVCDDGNHAETGRPIQRRSSSGLLSGSESGDVIRDISFEAHDRLNATTSPSKSLTIYSCDLCPYQSHRIHHLESHKKMHIKKPGCNSKCSYCPYYTNNVGFLRSHMLLHENGAPQWSDTSLEVSVEVNDDASPQVTLKPIYHSCDHCPFVTKWPNKLISHKQLHRPRASAPFKCSHCPLWAGKIRTIKRHVEVHESNYIESRIKCFNGLPSSPNKSHFKSPEKIPIKMPVADVHIEQEVLETATIKQKLIANRFGCTMSSKGPRRMSSSPVKLQTNGDAPCNGSGGKGFIVESSPSVKNESENSLPVYSVVLASEERRNNRNLQLWRCDKCPYSTHSILSFKRHVYLHGRRLTFECMYCDYSVSTCWRLAEHRRLHLVENQNLLHSQSVSNLIFLPSRVLSTTNVVHDPSLIGDRLNLLEDSPDFSAPECAPFRCSRCPFASERRPDFQAHVRCHFVRGLHSCPFCDYSTSVSNSLTTHVLLHFTLPGSETSSLPPSSCEIAPWKMLIEDISILKNDGLPGANGEHACALMKDVTKSETLENGDPLGSQQLHKCENGLAESVTSDEVKKTTSEKSATTNQCENSKLKLGGDSFVCQYCDRPFNLANQLIKHEAQHVVRC